MFFVFHQYLVPNFHLNNFSSWELYLAGLFATWNDYQNAHKYPSIHPSIHPSMYACILGRRLKIFQKGGLKKGDFLKGVGYTPSANYADVFNQLNFSGRLLLYDSLFHKNHQLSSKSRHLKNAGKIHSTWFWNKTVNVKLDERSQPEKIQHFIDIEKLLGVGNLYQFINNTSF